MADKENIEPHMTLTESVPQPRRSEQYHTVYTNQVEIGFTPWDIQFSFMQVHGRTGDLVIEEQVSVTMSPQHAKAMVFPLLKTIAQYEEEHGAIQLPNKQPPVTLSTMLTNLIDITREKLAAEAAKKPEGGDSKGTGNKTE